ncbi:MAG: hypothetical protein PGN24_07130, partial [Microbacterium arborescens]
MTDPRPVPSDIAVPEIAVPEIVLPDDIRELTEREVDASIRWLWQHATADLDSPGCGLVLDRDDLPGVATVAATGFALAAWCVGVERGVLDRAAVRDRVAATLRTLEESVPQRGGFLAHFVDAGTGERQGGRSTPRSTRRSPSAVPSWRHPSSPPTRMPRMPRAPRAPRRARSP